MMKTKLKLFTNLSKGTAPATKTSLILSQTHPIISLWILRQMTTSAQMTISLYSWIDSHHQVELEPELLTNKTKISHLLSKRSKMASRHTSKQQRYLRLRPVRIKFYSSSNCKIWRIGLSTKTKKMLGEEEQHRKALDEDTYSKLLSSSQTHTEWSLVTTFLWWQVVLRCSKIQI